eukprot:scaffold360_cov374-Pavlova_lutheri.AAC.45
MFLVRRFFLVQLFDPHLHFPPFLSRQGREPGVIPGRRDVFDDSRFGGQPHLGHNLDVVCDCRFSSHHHVIPQGAGSTQCSLSTEDAGLSQHGVVSDLHQVVELAVITDDGVSPAPSIHARVGSDFDVVSDDHAQLLRFLHHVSSLVHVESEAVLSHTHAVVQQAPFAYRTVVHAHVEAQLRASSDACVCANHASWSDMDVCAHHCAVANHRTGRDVCRGIHLGVRMDPSRS